MLAIVSGGFSKAAERPWKDTEGRDRDLVKMQVFWPP
jgi:hypothetical protein